MRRQGLRGGSIRCCPAVWPAVAALSAAGALVACGGGAHGAGPAPDGPLADGASSGGDGGGGGGGGGGGTMAADAATVSDAATAADGPVASMAAVTVIVQRDGVPLPNVRTYFVPRDGVPAMAVDTDASGRAVAFMDVAVLLAGTGSVTVVDAFPDDVITSPRFDQLRTVVGLRPNDQILVTQRSLTNVDVTIKAPVVAGADGYSVQTTCGDGSLAGAQVATGSATLSCAITDVLVLARQGTTPIKSLYHPNVAVSQGATIDLTADSYQDVGVLALHYTGLPASAAASDFLVGLSTPHGGIRDEIEGIATVTSGSASGSLIVPAVPPVGSVSSFFMLTAGHVVVDVGPVTSPYELDATHALLPDITQRPAYDVANHRVTWVEATGGAAPALSSAQLDVTRPGSAGMAQRQWRWMLVAPYTTGQVGFPLLPADVLPWTPVAGDTVSVQLSNEKFPISVDLVRSHVYDDAGAAQLDLTGRTVLVGSESN